jgi:chitosanase
MPLQRAIKATMAGVTIAVPLALTMSGGTAVAASDAKLSERRPATASSTLATANKAGAAVDGRVDTRWVGAATAGRQWLRVDLGSAAVVSRVKLLWDRNHASSYTVEASADGATWTPLYGTSTGNGGTDDLTGLTGRGRYVRVNATARSARGMGLYEFKVYGRTVAQVPAPAPTLPPVTTPAPTTPAVPAPAPTGPAPRSDLADPQRKDVAMRLVSSAENSSLDWRAQYGYIEDIGDGRGYTGGIIGFCSGTGDMLELVQAYTAAVPGNALAAYLPALRSVNGTSSHTGLDPGFTAAWRTAAADARFQRAQDAERDRVYFNPSVAQAKADGLRALGQFAYYDAIVMHGPGTDRLSFGGIRAAAMAKAKTPAQGGDESAYIAAFLDARKAVMLTEEAHSDTSRIDTAQRVFLGNGNLDLNTPLAWKVYGDSFQI